MLRGMHQKTPAQQRAVASAVLEHLGAKRKAAQKVVDELTAQLVDPVLHAREVEVSLSRIYELTGIAPNTTTAWVRKAAATPDDREPDSDRQDAGREDGGSEFGGHQGA